MGAESCGKVLFLLQGHSGFLVDRSERDDVHVGGGPLEGEAWEGTGKGEGSLIVSHTHGMYGELERNERRGGRAREGGRERERGGESDT